ncbi:MAG: hypothetical protein Q4F66_10910 [Clostridium sp.]|nr:hypothetical protein [Clostridium sp.]
MNIKLPGSYRLKRIILVILIIISICVLSYEFIQNKNDKDKKCDYEQEEFIGASSDDESTSEVLNEKDTSSEEKESEENTENLYSEKEETLYNDAYNLFFSNKYEEAVKKADELISEFPYNPKGYNIRGIAKSYNGDYDGGLNDIDKSLDICPDYGYALFNKALTYELYGNMDEALKWYNRDLEVEDYEWTYYGIASIYGRKGDVSNTVKYLKRAIEINPLVKDDAKTEADFNPVRGNQEFESLIKS